MGLAVVLPLTFAVGVGAVAAAPQTPSNERAAAASSSNQGNHGKPPTLEARAKQIITVTGRQFKDLNANGELDVYEDWRKPVDARVADLVEQMTLEEKAGLMLIDTVNAACATRRHTRHGAGRRARLHQQPADAPVHLPQRGDQRETM